MARRSFAGISVFGAIGLVRIGMAAAQAASAVSIDPATRTVTTSNFTVTWNTGADTEAITSLSWKGGANLTGSYGINACGFGGDGDVEYFGNSQAPPDPQAGGKVLVGGGTVTPERNGPMVGADPAGRNRADRHQFELCQLPAFVRRNRRANHLPFLRFGQSGGQLGGRAARFQFRRCAVFV